MSVWLPALFLTLGWAILVRTHSETWWWVSVLDLVPPHLWLLPVLWLTWRAVRQRHWGKVGGLLLCALALVHLGGWVWNKDPTGNIGPSAATPDPQRRFRLGLSVAGGNPGAARRGDGGTSSGGPEP